MKKGFEILTYPGNRRCVIKIWNSDTDEDILLDLNEKEFDILFEVMKTIKEKGKYPITREFLGCDNNELWED